MMFTKFLWLIELRKGLIMAKPFRSRALPGQPILEEKLAFLAIDHHLLRWRSKMDWNIRMLMGR